jgi:hypothetical protein
MPNLQNQSLAESGQIVTTGDTGVVTSIMILDGTIANTDVSTSAAIDLSKLASGTSAQIVLANSTGVATYTAVSGDITITNAGVTALASNITISNNLTVTGDLTVSGNTTTLNTANLNVEDNFIMLNSGETGSPTLNAGIEVERGTSTNVLISWDETTDKWQFTNDGSTYDNIAGTASPTFTGTPTLPTGTIATTQTSGNNTTAVATTAFVTTAVSSLPRGVVAYVREEAGSMSLNSMFGGIIGLNGTTTTFTPVAGRLYRCSYSIGSITQPASPGALIVTLNKSGGSNMDTSNLFESTTNIVSHTRVITLTSSQLGTSPTNLSLLVQTDTSVTVAPSSTRPTIIIVEDIGLA